MKIIPICPKIAPKAEAASPHYQELWLTWPNTYGALYVGKDVGNNTVVHLGAAAWGNDMSGP